MKIALVSPYDFAYPGGVARHITCLEKCLTGMEHQVKIIAPASKPVNDFGDRFIRLGTPRPVPSSGSIARITLSLNLDSKIKSLLEEEKFDIIHLHEPLVPTLCTSILRLSDTVNIGTFHASATKPSYRWFQPFAKLLMERWFRRLDGKIAVSRPAMEFANRHFPGTYRIIPNGIDVQHFSPDVAPIDELCDGKLNVLFVGRMEKRKGIGYLLGAYQQVKQKFPDSRLILVGPGVRLRHKYEKYVADNGLKDVLFIGAVEYKELPRYYQTADVFCAPATGQESFGVVLLEAMALGKAVVASNIPGYASVLTHGEEGVLVPPKDANSLAQAIISLLGNESLRAQMGEKGKKKSASYCWEHVARKVTDYYTEVLFEKRRK